MAGISAFRDGHGRLERLRLRIVSKLRICPSVCIRKSRRVLLNKRERLESVRHLHEIGRHWILLLDPLDFHNLGAFGKGLAVVWDAVLVGADHRGISQNRLDAALGFTDRDILPCVLQSQKMRGRLALSTYICPAVLRG